MKLLGICTRNIILLALLFAFGVFFEMMRYAMIGAEEPYSLILYIIGSDGTKLLWIAAITTLFAILASVVYAPKFTKRQKLGSCIACFLFFLGAIWGSFSIQDISDSSPPEMTSLFNVSSQETYRAEDGTGFWFARRTAADQVERAITVDPNDPIVMDTTENGLIDLKSDTLQFDRRVVMWDTVQDVDMSFGANAQLYPFFEDLHRSFDIISESFYRESGMVRLLVLLQIVIIFFAISLFLFVSTRAFSFALLLVLAAFRVVVLGYPRWITFGFTIYPDMFTLQWVFVGGVLVIMTCLALLFRRKHRDE